MKCPSRSAPSITASATGKENYETFTPCNRFGDKRSSALGGSLGVFLVDKATPF
jgi:hypothetical protein